MVEISMLGCSKCEQPWGLDNLVRHIQPPKAVMRYANFGLLALRMLAGAPNAGAMLSSFSCLAPLHVNVSTVNCADRPEVTRLTA